MIELCPVCGGSEFNYLDILWERLIRDWQLSAYEVEYINRQQGFFCKDCACNLRAMALALAIVKSYGFNGNLVQFTETSDARRLKVLEINEAGGLTPIISRVPNYQLIKYPDYDMTNIALDSTGYDLIIHSDTLEHVSFPISGLTECYRLLVEGGRCIFTVPVVVDRLTRSRTGLPLSRHGSPSEEGNDLIVHTEFGADVWKQVLLAGFSSATLYCLEYPAGLAIEGRK